MYHTWIILQHINLVIKNTQYPSQMRHYHSMLMIEMTVMGIVLYLKGQSSKTFNYWSFGCFSLSMGEKGLVAG